MGKKGTSDEVWKEINWKSFLLVSCSLWILVAIIFTLKYGIFQFSQGKQVLWSHIFFYNFNSNIIWMLLTPVLLWLLIKVLDSQKSWYHITLMITPIILMASILQSTLFLLLDHWLQNALDLWSLSMTVSEYFSQYFVEQVLDATLTGVIAMGLLFGYLQYHQNRWAQNQKAKLEAHLVRTRINNIKHQLQPHFLFNSLQTISNLIHVDRYAADQAVAELSDILRAAIKQLSHDKISMEKELQLVRKYLDFQKIRFADKINYHLDIAPVLLPYQVPVFLFQPLVENSIKHGFEQTGTAMQISISGVQQGKYMVLQIIDDGGGFSSNTKKPESTGIDHLMRRLDYLYPEDHEFTIDGTGEGTHITIQLPLE